MYLTSNKNKKFFSNMMEYQPTGQIANTTVVTKYESRWQLLQSYEYHIVSASIRKLRHCHKMDGFNLLFLKWESCVSKSNHRVEYKVTVNSDLMSVRVFSYN